MKKQFGQLILWLGIALLFSRCASWTSVDDKAAVSQNGYSNVLNYQGVPDSVADRSVFAFSDEGAWFAYALPGTNDTE